MSEPRVPALPGRAFTRRSLLVAALAGTALTAAACTGGGGNGNPADAVTAAQVDQLAAQVQVQETLVSAYQQAFTASPELASAAAVLADQARAQLDRLRAAAPGSRAGGSGSSPAAGAAPAGDAAGVRAWLRTQVTTAADAHAAACPTFTGGRAALLGSIAAGLRGHGTQLA